MNGAALGSAFTTRLGFSLWYVVPASTLLLGDPLLGAVIYGMYALVRTASAYPLLRWRARQADPAEVTDALRAWHPRARALCAAALVLVGAIVVMTVGF